MYVSLHGSSNLSMYLPHTYGICQSAGLSMALQKKIMSISNHLAAEEQKQQKGSHFQKERERRHSNLIADVIDMTGIRILRVSTSFYGFFFLPSFYIKIYQFRQKKKNLGTVGQRLRGVEQRRTTTAFFMLGLKLRQRANCQSKMCPSLTRNPGFCSNAIDYWKNSH